MAYNLWDDEETLTAPAPGAAPAPAPAPEPVPETAPETAAAAPKASGYNLWDDEPGAAPAAPAAPVVEAKPAAEKGYWQSFKDAVKIGVASNPDAAAAFADWMGDDNDTDPTSIKNRAAGFLRDAAKTVKGGAEIQIEGVQDIDSIGDAVTFALESVGQGIGSTVPSIVGGTAGAVIGSAAGPGGTAVGGILGATGPAMVTGIGGTYDALRNDPELAKKLLDGGVTQAQLKTYAGVGGAMIGSLDAFGIKKLADIVGIKGLTKEIAEETIKKTVLKAAKEGMLAEGGTEAAQQLIESAAVALAGGSKDLGKALLDAVNAGIGGALGGGVIAGGGHAVTGGPQVKDPAKDPNDPASVDQETPALPEASTPGGTGAPPPQPSTAAPGADAETVKVVPPGTVDPDAAAAARGDPVAPQHQTPPVTSVAEPQAQPVENVSHETIAGRTPAEERTPVDWGDEDQVVDPELYGEPSLTEKMKIRPETPKEAEIEIAAPRDDIVAALNAGKPEPIGTGQSPEPKPVTLNPLPGQTPPPGGPPAATAPSMGPPQEMPPAPPVVTEPGVGVAPAAAVPSAGVAPGVPAAPAGLGATPQVGPTGSEPVAQVLETGRPSAAEAGMAQGASPLAAEAGLGVAPGPDITAASEVVQTPAVETLPPAVEELQQAPAAVVTSPAAELAPALSRRASDAAGQLREILHATLKDDEYSTEQIEAVTDEIMRGIEPRLAASGDSVNAMIRAFEDEAIAGARARLPAMAEELELQTLEREAEIVREAREAAAEKRAKGAPQERARTTQEGTKPAEDIAREGPADEKPFERRAEKAIKEQGEVAPSYYRKGLEAIQRRKAIKGNVKGEKLAAREAARAEAAAARAEELADRRRIEAEEIEAEKTRAEPEKEIGTKHVSAKEQQKQVVKRKKIRARAGLNKKVDPELSAAIRDMELPGWDGYGTPSWAKRIRAAITKLWNAFTPRNKDGTVMTKTSPDNAPETNFLIFAKNNMGTEDGLVEVISAKQYIDEGKMVDAANMMRDAADLSAGIGGGKLQEVTKKTETKGLTEEELEAWEEKQATKELKITEFGYADDADQGSVLAGPAVDFGKEASFTARDGDTVSVPSENVTSVKRLLSDLDSKTPRMVGGVLGRVPHVLRKMMVDRLQKMVGTVPVYYVSPEVMLAEMEPGHHATVGDMSGLYIGPSLKGRARGRRGYILMSSRLREDLEWNESLGHPELGAMHAKMLHVAMHEASHAATQLAIDENFNGAGDIFARLYAEAMQHPALAQFYAMDPRHGVKNGTKEFAAEGHSNVRFQEALASIQVPKKFAHELRTLARGKTEPNLWDVFVGAVANALHFMGFGKPGMTMLEAVVRATPSAMMGENVQAFRAKGELARRAKEEEDFFNSFDEPRGVADPLLMQKATATAHNAVSQRATNVSGSARRAHMSWLQTTMGLMRSGEPLFGGEGNAYTKAGESLLKRNAAAAQHAKEGDKLTHEKARFQKKHPVEAEVMDNMLAQSAIHGIDPRLDVAGNIAKGNVSAKGKTDVYKRQEIAKHHAVWNKLSSEAKTQAEKEIAFYDKVGKENANLQIETTAKQIVKSGVKLPKGVGVNELVAWVKSKKIHNERGHSIRPRDQFDEDMHAALGGSAETLASLEKTLLRNGVYAPLMRDGNWVVSGYEEVKVPPNATVADANLVPNAKRRDNMLVFKNAKDAEQYQKDAVKDGIQISNVDSIWVDPLTGKRTTKADVYTVDEVDPQTGKIVQKQIEPKQHYVVHVQNKYVEFVDSEGKSKARTKELRKQGLIMNGHQSRETFMTTGLNDISPAHVTRMINAVGKQTENEDLASFMKTQVQLAALRTQSGNRARHRNLKRQGIKGYNKDSLRGMMNYVSANAHFRASLQEGNDAWEHMAEAREYAEAHKTDVNGEVQKRREHLDEMRKRLENKNWMDNSGESLVRQLTSWSAIVYLASPAYSAINAMQPGMTTFPILSAKYGEGNVLKEMFRTFRTMNKAYSRIGRVRTLGKGLKLTGQAIRGFATGQTPLFSTHDDLTARFAQDKDGALLAKAFTEARDMGLLDDAGIEQELIEHGKSWMTRLLHRISAVARAMPTAIEMMNRGVTIATSVRLQKALDPTLSDETVIKRAMHDLEQTQFGYSAANMPTTFSNKYGAALFQFKKYGVSMGNVIGHNAVKAVSRGATKAERKIARKTLTRIALMGIAMAGVAGVPGVELFKTMALITSMTLGTGDWDDAEEWMQTALSRITGAATAEAIIRGLPRLMNLDIASRVGYDNMYLFGEPRKHDEASTKAWIFDSLAGPVIGMATAVGKAYASGDWSKAPLPKLVTDTMKAWKKYQTGEFTGTEAAIKAFGIQPGSASAPYETGPKRIGIKKAEEKKSKQDDRKAVMNPWLNVPPGPKQAAARRAAWEDIKEHNKTVPRKERIDRGELIRADQRRKKEERKNTREAKKAA